MEYQADVIKLLKLWQTHVFENLKASEILEFSQWAIECFKLSKSTGSPGSFDPFAFQVGLMQMMQMTAIEKLVVFKPAQIGYTQLLLAFLLYETTHRGRSTILYLPRDNDAKDFTTSHIDEVLQICPSIASELTVVADGGRADKKDSGNTTLKKIFKQAVAYIRGAKSANAFRRLTAPTVLVDEVDAMDADIEGEGRVDKLAASRSSGVSTFVKMILGSTPTISGSSLIETIADEIDVKLSRYYKCQDCDHLQPLVFGGRDEKFGLKFSQDKSLSNTERAKTCRYVCRACGHSHSYGDLPKMDAGGVWRNDKIYLDQEIQVFRELGSDEIVETPMSIVLYLNGLMSYTFEWWRTTLAFLDAVDQAKNGDISAIVTWNNHQMGLCYVDKGVKSISSNVLFERSRQSEYCDGNSLPNWVQAITLGIDIQGSRVECSFVGWGWGQRSIVFDHMVLAGDITTSNVSKRILEISNRKFYRQDKTMLQPITVCCDSGYQTSYVKDMCSHDPMRLIPIKGSAKYDAPDVTFPAKHKDGVYFTYLGTQHLKDIVASRVSFEDLGPGSIEWPDNPEVFDEAYFNQFTAESKKIRRVNGQPKRVWTCANGVRNEAIDCYVYALAAIKIAERNMGFQFEMPSQDEIEESKVEKIPLTHAAFNNNPNAIALDDIFNKMAG